METNYQYLFTKKLFEYVVAPVVDYGALFGSHRFSDQEVEKSSSRLIGTFLGLEENIH